MDCLFCKIIEGSIPCTKVYEDDRVFAFRDINPQAKVHILLTPKKHMRNILECDAETAAALTAAIANVAAQEGLTENGFRVISNCGKHGCQSVDHLHVHLVGGEQLSEKMS
ncbi:MAG: histidine triad nucleotide-binding protein [Clostridia bacterium]|nr:histidine triad nucleotide-binding protein [Clostridia bacterium]